MSIARVSVVRHFAAAAVAIPVLLAAAQEGAKPRLKAFPYGNAHLEYEIRFSTAGKEPGAPGTWDLVRVDGNECTVVVPSVKEYRTHGSFVVGKAARGYFVFFANWPGKAPWTEFYSSESQWRQGLANVGVPADIPLTDPETAARAQSAATRPAGPRLDQQILLWLTLLSLASILLAMAIGWLVPWRWVRIPLAPLPAVPAWLAGGLFGSAVDGLLPMMGACVMGCAFWPVVNISVAELFHWLRRCWIRGPARAGNSATQPRGQPPES